jgi:hypothetical protein
MGYIGPYGKTALWLFDTGRMRSRVQFPVGPGVFFFFFPVLFFCSIGHCRQPDSIQGKSHWWEPAVGPGILEGAIRQASKLIS